MSTGRDIIVIGGSAGAIQPLRAILHGLTPDLPASIFVVIHRADREPNLLPSILDAAGPLPVVIAGEGQRFAPGCVYLPPNDRHLLVGSDHVHVRRGPHENRSRPAIDPLFRSAAAHATTRVIGVVLSGLLSDGTAGLLAIKRCGGLALVQDPGDAAYDSMPRSALAHVEIDAVLPAQAMAARLTELCAEPRPPPLAPPEDVRIEAMVPALDIGNTAGLLGEATPFTCPDCHGALFEIDDNGLLRYRCHTGHAYTIDVLQSAQAEALERAMYQALRAQHEHMMIARRLAGDMRLRGQLRGAADLERRAASYGESADMLQRLLAAAGDTVAA